MAGFLMAEYSYSKTSNASRLDEELHLTSFGATKYTGTTVDRSESPHAVTVYTSSGLDAAEQGELDATIAAHNPSVPSLDQKIHAARIFGTSMIEQWQRTFINEGIVQAGATHAVATALDKSSSMARIGNLYSLDAELATVTPIATFLEAARLTQMRNQVRTYLGLPPV
jgi:hypothetical protein